jgi:hypothetical protein
LKACALARPPCGRCGSAPNCHSPKFSNLSGRAGVSKISSAQQISDAVNKKFDAPNFLCAYIATFVAGELPALLRTVMRNARTHIDGFAALLQPLVRLADRSCMSVMTQGPNVQLKAGLIHKARV